MFFDTYDDFLKKYEKELNKISSESPNYKQLIQSTTENFFWKIEKKYLKSHLENINKENFYENKIHRDSLNYLMQLTLKKCKNPSNFFNIAFPDFVEVELTHKSDWLIIRVFQILISCFVKPKLKLSNLPDAKKLLIAVRTAQAGFYKVNDEEFNDAMDIIINKFLQIKKNVSSIYIPINEDKLFEEWELYKKNPCKIFHCLDMDNLLHYLTSRISSLQNPNEKKYLYYALPALKDYVYKNDLLLFRKKYEEIINFFKKNPYNNTIEITQSIKNILLKIIQRFCILNRESLSSQNIYLIEKIEKVKFYYEAYRTNWEKSYVIKENTANYYEIFNSLENVLYDANLLETNDRIESIYFRETMNLALINLQKNALQIENFSEKVILKNLSNDMCRLSKIIFEEVLDLKEQMQEADAFDDAWTEWDDVPDISGTSDADQFELEKDLNRDSVFITNADIQSDSGISEHEVEVQNSSKYPRILPNDSRSVFFGRAISNEQAENSNQRSFFRHSYHG